MRSTRPTTAGRHPPSPRGASAGQLDAQIRGELQALKDTVDKNQGAFSPAPEEWRSMNTLGVGISGVIAVAGLHDRLDHRIGR